ncbi:MAG: DUF4852 domain-containing protein [Alphaproteobacteria bacterium]
MKIVCNIALGILLLAGSPSLSAEEYIEPTPLALTQSMFRFGALDINNDLIIDDYAKIAECDLFTAFHNDDFRWQKIRAGLRTKIRNEVVTYPTSYYVVGKLYLDRYDFKNKTFKINNDQITTNPHVSSFNSFTLHNAVSSACNNNALKVLPMIYHAVLETQMRVPGFVMGESDANALLSRMNASGNTARKIYVKFNLSIVYADKVQIDYSKMDLWNNTMSWVGKTGSVRMYSRLESIEYFEDSERTKKIYVYNPN